MKRLFCFLLTGVIFISLSACGETGSKLDADRLETTDKTTVGSPLFDPVDLSYENVAKLTDFKCDVSYQGKNLTVEGTRAKDLYKLVYNEMGKQEHTPASSDGNYVYLVFYNIEEGSSENISVSSFWGTYTIYDDGLLVFSGSPYHSASFDYKLEAGVYDSVIDIISGENE